MDSSSAHWENYWQIPPPLSPLLLILGFSETRPAQQRTPHRSAPAHTPTCRTKKLASTPPELAGAQPAAPRAPRPAPRGPTAGTFGFSETRPAQNAHHTGQLPRTPPLAAPKSSPARPPSSLAPSRPRPRPAPRAPRANGWDPVWATTARRGCPSRTAARRGPRSRGAVPSIGLAAGARIVQAPGLPPAPAPGACRAALQSGRGTVRNLWQPLRAAQAPGA
jgi:hypothetical protein